MFKRLYKFFETLYYQRIYMKIFLALQERGNHAYFTLRETDEVFEHITGCSSCELTYDVSQKFHPCTQQIGQEKQNEAAGQE